MKPETAKKLIIVTRPDEDAEIFSANLQEMGFQTHHFPALKILPLIEAELEVKEILKQGASKGILITSRNALHALPQTLLPLHLVGNQTAEAVKKMGMGEAIRYRGESAEMMIQHLRQTMEHGTPLLYLRGRDVTKDLRAALPQLNIHPVIAYEAKAAEIMPELTQSILHDRRADAITFFSLRSLTSVDQLLDKAGLRSIRDELTAFCFSASIAERARELGWKRIESCATPSTEAMVQQIQMMLL